MRVPLMPLALSLAVGGLLYAAYQGNKRIVDGVASRPRFAATDARSASLVDSKPNSATNPTANSPRESPAEAVEREDDDLPEMDERCTTIATVVTDAEQAIDAGVPLEEFVRRPLIAFVDDPALRSELESLARDRYKTTPAMARLDVLREARCLR